MVNAELMAAVLGWGLAHRKQGARDELLTETNFGVPERATKNIITTRAHASKRKEP
jgi:hypothetical protein